MAAKKPWQPNVYVPREPFTAPFDGHDHTFTPQTTVGEGHPLLKLYPDLFTPLQVQYPGK